VRCMLAGIVGVGVALLVAAAPSAAEFWLDKDFTRWSPNEVERMFIDSPWAKKVTIVLGRLSEQPLEGFQGGGAGLGGGGDRPARGGDVGDDEFQRIRRVNVFVVWASALPVRQALVRRQVRPDAPISPDQQRQLAEDWPLYTLAVAGMPTQVAAKSTIDEVRARTALKAGRKAPIAPQDIRLAREGTRSVRIEFLFPKGDGISPDDKEVVFTTKLGDVEITRKFKLADMMVGGRLAL